MRNWSKISNFDLTMRSHHRSKLPGIQNENELVSANFLDLKFCIKTAHLDVLERSVAPKRTLNSNNSWSSTFYFSSFSFLS
jgi:hypothetical protein